jgi:phosphoribosylanthranilate isomerase
VSADRAAAIVERLREEYSADQVRVFGVFVNATLDDILWTIREANLYGIEQGFGIQLHGDEPPELIRELHSQGLGRAGELLQVLGHVPEVPIVRALRVQGSDLAAPGEYLRVCEQTHCLPQAVLLDAHSDRAYGGTGERLDWMAVGRRGGQLLGLPLVLAGGLNPENVTEAIAAARPAAVDTASGVEVSPGLKDAAKVMAFVARAKAAMRANDD